ncbi:MAG: trigger factor [Gemmatimonadetes bacterium]|nr:trigger factor [Gemmatimonadota bacterium]MYA77656.1 trigger factor [Gemmatimonadota bacterium]MYG15678.1 trigger factor [Gemmatimonadota bacterium]MYH19870.1 trigger factor [Gemmatimonadota bacterium]MYK98403.1 trigger factor [Gemmatimonadota bacterium]
MALNYTVSEPKPWKRVLEIEVPSDAIQSELNEAYARYSREVRLPGFRRGKVPLSVLKAQLGNEIRAEVLEKKIPEYLNSAHERAEIKPISQPVIEEIEFDEGQDLKLRASVEVKPAIELKQYKELRVTRRTVNTTDEDVDERLERLRERYASVVRIDGEAEKDHFIRADIQHADASGVPIIGRKEENQFFQVGSGRLGEGFDTQLTGVRADEDRTVKTELPSDYPDETLAGQEACFIVHVHEVLERQLPEADDDFAVDIGMENLDALKQSIREEIEREPDLELRRDLVTQIVDAHDFEVPESMMTAFLEQVVADARRSTRGRDEVDENALRQEYRPVANSQIMRHLILDAIAEQEGLAVDQEELDERLEAVAARGQASVDQVRRLFRENGRLDRIEADLKEEKVVEFLVEHADIQTE